MNFEQMRETYKSSASFIELRNASKEFQLASDRTFIALSEINLELAAGELVAVLGKSGSGKSTLLNLLAGLDKPTNGEVFVGGKAIQTLSENELARWRGETVGVVFQFFQLLPTLTVAENIQLAMDFVGVIPQAERKKRALELLELVEIADQADKLPATLSGGQQQRAAIARALANDPPLLLADEPTGNLDSKTTASILELFARLKKEGKTLIVVTHDEDLAGRADKIVRLADGKIVGNERVQTDFVSVSGGAK